MYYVPLAKEDVPEERLEAAQKMLAMCREDLGLGEVAMHFYREELPSERREREAAYKPVQRKEACSALGRQAELGPSKGSVHRDRPGEMSVCVTGPATDVAFTVAHEARHLWQYRNRQYHGGRLARELEYRAAEADADDYAYLMLSRFMGERWDQSIAYTGRRSPHCAPQLPAGSRHYHLLLPPRLSASRELLAAPVKSMETPIS